MLGISRSGRSSQTTPVFFTVWPCGYSWLSSVKLTTGPPASIGSVGNWPARGPGSIPIERELRGK
jgi:hypothetical protein